MHLLMAKHFTIYEAVLPKKKKNPNKQINKDNKKPTESIKPSCRYCRGQKLYYGDTMRKSLGCGMFFRTNNLVSSTNNLKEKKLFEQKPTYI